jgi:hypothetical protein
MRKPTLKTSLPFLTLLGVAIAATFVPSLRAFDEGKYNLADIAWILVATALVFLMTRDSPFLRGNGESEECAFHHDEKCSGRGCCQGLVDRSRV